MRNFQRWMQQESIKSVKPALNDVGDDGCGEMGTRQDAMSVTDVLGWVGLHSTNRHTQTRTNRSKQSINQSVDRSSSIVVVDVVVVVVMPTAS